MVASNLPAILSPPPPEEAAGAETPSRREARHDAQLIRRFNDGDEAAFREIVARYREKLFGVALRLLRNRADAEEIAQDAFVRAHRALARFRGDCSLATWLHRIALNLARNRYWYCIRRCQHSMVSLDAIVGDRNSSTLAELIASEAPGAPREVAQSEFAAIISLCTTQISAVHREILTLRNVRQCSYQEIGRILGLKIGTVKSRIGRARAELRLKVADTFPEFDASRPGVEWFEPVRTLGRLAASGG